MMDFLNWGGKHPWLFFFLLAFAASACHGIGHIGSTRYVVKKEED
jgi:hypothetical protein